MSINRWNAKTDKIQKDLVKKLEQAGIQVWVIKQPCDLLLRFWCNRHRDHCWQPLEAKTPTKTGRIRKRLDQVKQDEFCRDTSTPRVTSFESAWIELNKRHSLGRVDTPCVLNCVPA